MEHSEEGVSLAEPSPLPEPAQAGHRQGRPTLILPIEERDSEVVAQSVQPLHLQLPGVPAPMAQRREVAVTVMVVREVAAAVPVMVVRTVAVPVPVPSAVAAAEAVVPSAAEEAAAVHAPVAPSAAVAADAPVAEDKTI